MTGSLRCLLAALGFVAASAAAAQEAAKEPPDSWAAAAAAAQEPPKERARSWIEAAVKRVPNGAAGAATMVADAGVPPEPAARPRSGTAAGSGTVAVMIDHAKVVRLPERAHTVIVGNPMIADISVQRNGIVVVTGKAYGVTNLIALDAAGGMLAESLISVQATGESVVVVQRGMERESYSCTPKCQPSILLGDSAKYFGEVGGQASQRNGLATQR